MDSLFPHENLDVWRLSKDLCKLAYAVTKGFPNEERFGLVNQIRRAAVSVMSNLAEGSGRTSTRDQAPFSQMAYGSLLEVDAQFQLAVDLDYLPQGDYQTLRRQIAQLAPKISALRASQLRRRDR